MQGVKAMADISNLEGINSDEVDKLCQAGIGTVEDFLVQIEPLFNYGIMYMSISTGIKADRLIQFVPPERLRASVLPDCWIEGLTARVLREAPPDDPWLKRCELGAKHTFRGLRGNWLGWQKNLPILALIAGLLLLLALTFRAAGGLQWLPAPFGLRDRALIVACDMNSGKALAASDFYQAMLPFRNDYFRPSDDLQGLVLARPVSGQMPLRFQDVLRFQVIAARDIQADATIQEEDVSLVWTTYQPGAALGLKEVCGHKASRGIRKDGVVLSEFINPAE
jgi:hypothetical protein